MFDQLKKDWEILRENPPGARFQARYKYRKFHSPPSGLRRILKIAAGIILIPLGIVLWFIPGPGWLVIMVGLALLAGRFRWLSVSLDRLEVIIRRIIPGGK
jgi:uncharacterized membrane protein YdbT with pleckstrin-like domain